jgi:hypothetical protein
MIQRVQTIWFLLAALALGLMLFFPLVSKIDNSTELEIHTIGLYQDAVGKPGPGLLKENFTPLLITNIAVAIICFVNIFNFKRRTLQKKIAIVSIILIGGFAFWCSVFAQKLPGGLNGATFDFAAYLPAFSIICCILAIAGINKDEKLIRSADRLR